MNMEGLQCFDYSWGLGGKQTELIEEVLQSRALDVAEMNARRWASSNNLENVVAEEILDRRTIRKDIQRCKTKCLMSGSALSKSQVDAVFRNPPAIISFLQLSCLFLAW